MSLDNRHSLALPYWARPGIATLAKKASGSSKKDEDADEDDEDEDDEDDEDEDDDELADLTEDELREELRKTQASLSKASGSSKAKRDKIKKLNQELADARKPKSKKDDEDDGKPDLDSVRAEAAREEREKSDARIKKAEVRGALRAAGVPSERLKKAVGLVALEDLDVDDDGEVEGLDDALDELKKEWPELFPKSRKRRESVSGDAGDGEPKRRKELTASQKQAALVTGKR